MSVTDLSERRTKDPIKEAMDAVETAVKTKVEGLEHDRESAWQAAAEAQEEAEHAEAERRGLLDALLQEVDAQHEAAGHPGGLRAQFCSRPECSRWVEFLNYHAAR